MSNIADEPPALVATGFHRLVAAMTAHAVMDRTMFVVTSPVPGVGKTCSTRAAVTALDIPCWWIDASSAQSPSTINLELLAASGYRAPINHRSVFDTTIELGDLTRSVRPVIVVDDAHDLPVDTMAHLFMLHRRLHLPIGLIAKAGYGSANRNQRELLDRVDRWIEIDALPATVMIDALHQHHPLYDTIDDHQLTEIDRTHAKGRWRRWHQFTTTALRYINRDDPRLTRAVVAHTLQALSWDRRPDPLTAPAQQRAR